jgi:Tfp pilus assembly protein PilF
VRAAAVQRLLEVDDCLTGVDADALRVDFDDHLAHADEDFTKATRLAPDYGEAWSNLGVVDNLNGAHDEAVKHLSEALEHPARLENPALTRAHLGWAQFQLGDHVMAAKELLQALQFQPGMCVATYRLGRVYFAREEWEKAAEQFQGVTDDPTCGSQEASLYLMKARIAQGLLEDARVARDACIQMAGQSCIAAQCRTEGTDL